MRFHNDRKRKKNDKEKSQMKMRKNFVFVLREARLWIKTLRRQEDKVKRKLVPQNSLKKKNYLIHEKTSFHLSLFTAREAKKRLNESIKGKNS